MTELDAEIPKSDSYSYNFKVINESLIQVVVTPLKDNIRAYTGVVFSSGSSEMTVVVSQLCVSDTPTKNTPSQIIGINREKPECPKGYKIDDR